jgi:hypothetical protein
MFVVLGSASLPSLLVIQPINLQFSLRIHWVELDVFLPCVGRPLRREAMHRDTFREPRGMGKAYFLV